MHAYIHTDRHTYITLHYITLHYITLHYITYIHTYIHHFKGQNHIHYPLVKVYITNWEITMNFLGKSSISRVFIGEVLVMVKNPQKRTKTDVQKADESAPRQNELPPCWRR